MAEKKEIEIIDKKTPTLEDTHGKISNAIKSRKGKVFVYTSKGNLLHIEKKGEKRTSKALKEDKAYWKKYGLMAPPYDPEGFIFYYEANIYFMRTVDQTAQDVSGQGYQLVPREGLKEDIGENWEEDADVKEFKDKAERFLAHPNDKGHSIEEIIRRLMIDYGTVGWLNMEVIRNNEGGAGEINHVKSYTVRIHESESKYCQSRYRKGQTKRAWFKRFGEEEDILVENGDPAKSKAGTDDSKLANEMIMKENYYIKSDYYGTPDALGALGAIVSMIGIRDFNLSFFENYGIPAALVILTGDWEEGSERRVMEFIDTGIRGTENAHKTLAMLVPMDEEGKQGKAEWIPLVQEIKEGSFMKDYYKHMRNEILVSGSMPPYRIGIAEEGSLGGTAAKEMDKVYLDSRVDPLQAMIEAVFNQQLLPTFWDKKDKENNPLPIPYKFKLRLPDIRNVTEELDNATKLFDRQAMKVDELRAVMNLPPWGKDNGGEERFRKNIYIRPEEESLEKGASELMQLMYEIEAKIGKAHAQ